MKQITLREFLVKDYLIAFIIHLLSLNLVFFLNLDFFIFLIPIVSFFISNTISLNNKEISVIGPLALCTKRGVNHCLFIFFVYYVLFTILGILQLMAIFKNTNIRLYLIYLFGTFVGYIISYRKIKNKIATIKETPCQYKFKEFNDENIINFLKEKQIDYDGYLFGFERPKISTMLSIYGYLTSSDDFYLIVFNQGYMHMFRLYGLKSDTITNWITIKLGDINNLKVKNSAFEIYQKIDIYLTNKQRLNLYCTKKMSNIKNQEENIKKLILSIEDLLKIRFKKEV